MIHALKSTRHEGWNAFAGEVCEMLGLAPKAKLPPEGMSAREIQGITVYVRPLPPLVRDETRPRWWGVQRRFSLRVRAICPECGRDVAASRLPQHSRVHA